ncbi:hypothetical protein ACFQ2B_24255 [Streptomyces stramineus]|uniref:Sortase n=1 Tax=Streptomyces stramineus TaxID=173861 RepID=A0ABP3JQW7_9ACTN
MSAKTRIAAATVLTAAVGAVLWPTAAAVAADTKDTARQDNRPTAVQQIRLPDGSRARLTSGTDAPTVTVTTRGTGEHTLDSAHPAADLNRLHLRILGAGTDRPTLRATLDGTGPAHYYDFTSGTAHRTTATTVVTPATTNSAGAGGTGTAHLASGNPVQRAVEAGETLRDRHDMSTPALAGAALLTAAGGACAVRVALRRQSRTGA